MKNVSLKVLFLTVILAVVMAGCFEKKEEAPKLSSAKEITGISVNSSKGLISGTISGSSIEIVLPYGTDKTQITPIIAISGKTVVPASGTLQNFTTAVAFTVTAEDGSTKVYNVSVSLSKDEAKTIMIVGDSISSGYNPDYNRHADTYGWVKMFVGEGGGIYPTAQAINVKNLWTTSTVINVAIAGTKASDWNNDTNLTTRGAFNSTPEITVVYLGGNDFFEYLKNDGQVTANEEAAFEANLRGVVAKIKTKYPATKLIMPNYYDLFDGQSGFLQYSTSPAVQVMSVISTKAVVFNNIIKSVAQDNNAKYVDVYTSFVGHAYGRFIDTDTTNNTIVGLYTHYLLDPSDLEIHPNTAGHKVIEGLIYNAFKEIYDAE